MSREFSRRFFLQSITALGGLFFFGLWHRLIEDKEKNRPIKTISVSLEGFNQIAFFDQFIVIKQAGKVEVISSKCTHMGCRIDKIQNDQLFCPCHGSSFDLNGRVLTGPAIESLPKLPFTIDKDNSLLTVSVS